MANTRGVFFLRKITEEKIPLEEWVDVETVWHSPSPFLSSDVGYFGGGNPGPGVVSIVDKTTFTSDTTARVPGANLTLARDEMAATGSQTHAYFSGGYPGPKSTMDKIDYSTDTTAAAPGANLNTARYYHSAIGNKDAGYFAGGSPGGKTTIEKTTYSTDTTATLPSSANFSHSPNIYMGAVGNKDAGYFAGGYETSETNYSTVHRITYSNDTTANVFSGSNLSSNRRYLQGSGNSTDGYFTGGTPGPFNYVTIVDKITYSSETTARVPTANLSETRYIHAATGNSSNGYIGGGSGPKSSIDKITYSNDTTAALPSGAYLSLQRRELAATGPRTNALSDLVPAPSSPANRYVDGAIESPNTGYFGGGDSTDPLSIVDKLTFSIDTIVRVPGANLIVGRKELAAIGSKTHGYFGGGGAPSKSSVEKTSYSSDTTAALPSNANLSSARYVLAATGNLTDGYFGGGFASPGGRVTTMNKTTYSTDTTDPVPGASLSDRRSQLAATGNSTHG